MGQTLDNGIYLPSEGERNCYEGLAGNWVALDNHLGSTNIHVTINDKQAWDGHVADTTIHVTSADKQTWNSHVADTTIHVTSADKQAWDGHVADSVKHVTAEDKAAWNGKADASALTAHTGDTTIHVTAADKQTWNGKQDALSQTQLDAVNSGIDSTKVQQIATNTSDIRSLQSGKANDSNVVHKSGNETVGGVKTFTDNNMIKTSSPKVLLINTSQTGNTAPSSNTASFFRFDGGTVNNFGGVQCEFLTTGENRLTNYVNDITKAKVNTIQQRASSTTAMTVFNADLLAPAIDGVTALGSSSKRWSDVQTYKVNGLEPSSLSLPVFPSSSSSIDISAYITDMTGSVANSYTPPANGYITFVATGSQVQIFSDYGLQSKFSIQSGSTMRGYHPVLKNEAIKIYIIGTSIKSFRFIPCQGNV